MTDDFNKALGSFSSYQKMSSSLQRGGDVDLACWLLRLRSAVRWAHGSTLDEERELAFSKAFGLFDVIDDYVANRLDSHETVDEHRESLIGNVVSTANAMLAEIHSRQQDRKETHNQADPAVREAVLNLTGGRCAYCDAEIRSGSYDSDSQFCVEHVVPKSCGGPDHLNNYVPACKSCNNSKGGGHVLTFIKRNLPNRIARAELKVVNGGEA